MKNFEKNLDRVIDALKEINQILKETNLEMQKAFHETKAIRYVIYNPYFDNYVRFSGGKIMLCNLERADIFEDQHLPFEMLDKCGSSVEDFVVREISVKVVK